MIVRALGVLRVAVRPALALIPALALSAARLPDHPARLPNEAATSAPTLRVRAPGGAWRMWWRADRAPARWPDALPAVAGAVRWQRAAPGVEWGELELSGDGEAYRTRAVLVRIDPAVVRLTLHAAARPASLGGAGPWDLDAAPAAALVALNAGQFTDAGPWGWVVHRGRELQPPGAGALAAALVVDSAGRAHVVDADAIGASRATAVEAVQSYPAVLAGDGAVPAALVTGDGIDLEHRDGRLAIGELRDGRLLVALTRFDGLGGALASLPFGLTVPESAALMGALGCRSAVLLDGGLSAQLLVREAGGAAHRWTGTRRVPLGLVALPGSPEPAPSR